MLPSVALPPPRQRRVLLLGGTGFLGTNLAISLEGAGHAVLVTGRARQARDGRAAVPVSLQDTDGIIAIVRAERVDTVVQMACGMLPSSTDADYRREMETVNLPTYRLARMLADADVAMTFLSSGGTVYGAVDGISITEDQPCRPISLYGQSKLETELHLSFLARTCGLRLLVVRPSNPYGRHQPLRGAQGLISVILGRAIDREPLDVWGDGSAVRDYIHVDDAVHAIGGLIASGAEGTYNVGSGVGHSLLDVVRCVEDATGSPVPLRFHPGRAADVPRLVLNVDRLRGAGLWQARSLRDGICSYAGQLGMGVV